MTDLSIVVPSCNHGALVPPHSKGSIRSRLHIFARWLDDTGGQWWKPDLRAYRDHLFALGDKSPITVQAYLSTVRSRYHDLLLSRDYFYTLAPRGYGPADTRAIVNEIIDRVKGAIDPRTAPVKVPQVFTVSDSDRRLWLEPEDATALLQAIFGDDDFPQRVRQRNATMVRLALDTGLRARELVSLEVNDLEANYLGQAAVQVRAESGKGFVSRVVPYGESVVGYHLTHAWLRQQRITEGRVFRSFFKGYKTMRDSISTRAFESFLECYPIVIDNEQYYTRPHDLRRTYARWQYIYAGLAPEQIRLRLGHAKIETTLGYIGDI